MPLLSHSPSLAALFCLPLLVACGYGDHMHHDDYYQGGSAPPPSSVIEAATIDVDQTLDVDAGAGAGIFIEYEAGGTYHFTTSCDTGLGDCYWDIIVTPLDGAKLKSTAPAGLESDDSISVGDNRARLVAYTGADFDGFTLETEPGAAIELDGLLDNENANRYFFWVGDGALHNGAPSNPVDLVPSGE
jgi:hypothetical protein